MGIPYPINPVDTLAEAAGIQQNPGGSNSTSPDTHPDGIRGFSGRGWSWRPCMGRNSGSAI